MMQNWGGYCRVWRVGRRKFWRNYQRAEISMTPTYSNSTLISTTLDRKCTSIPFRSKFRYFLSFTPSFLDHIYRNGLISSFLSHSPKNRSGRTNRSRTIENSLLMLLLFVLWRLARRWHMSIWRQLRSTLWRVISCLKLILSRNGLTFWWKRNIWREAKVIGIGTIMLLESSFPSEWDYYGFFEHPQLDTSIQEVWNRSSFHFYSNFAN